MKIESNYSISKLFISKDITVFIEGKTFIIKVYSVKDFYDNADLNSVYHLWTSSISDLQKLYFTKIKDNYEAITTMIFDYGQYSRYRDIANKMRDVLSLILPQVNIDMTQKVISVNGITITSEI